ncbi:malonyl-CoA decarboxylase [Paenochrobactrum pullorum]|uniref:malonyl-CoA decarboxylase n=1 Tax=Paenochrobactrum pullorum TaxID=1324351 RepID=UPI0035BC7EDA
MSSLSFFRDMIDAIAERGQRLILIAPRSTKEHATTDELAAQCEHLLSSRGEASGLALAHDILTQWQNLNDEEQTAFMQMLLQRFGADDERIERAITSYQTDKTPKNLARLHLCAEPKRQELIRRLNAAPKGTAKLVQMREKLLKLQQKIPELEAVDADFTHLFTSWFNRGFLQLRSIDWTTPAHILEKIIQYEAVHAIGNWNELRSRLAPADRRCFAFFHPQLTDDPLIFVEVALTRSTPDNIADVLDDDREPLNLKDADTAVFYSISNCQDGLRGISFGSFLIKQVVEELRRDLPQLKTFVTLSPVPAFAHWLKQAGDSDGKLQLDHLRTLIARPDWYEDDVCIKEIEPLFDRIAAHYFINVRDKRGRVLDPVARFHLGNGARLERLNFMGDLSKRALHQSHGLMVNYLYKLDDIERNHEAYAERGEVIAAPEIIKLAAKSDNK